jgi:DNA-binding response OmpR family regulator/anti-sigma regulatory factor (Ser/Thr protein kinase)
MTRAWSPGEPAGGGGILVLDDSLTVRMDVCEALEAAGLRPTPCATLAQARDLLAAHRFALVILDVLLPDGDGVDLLREIRADPRLAGTTVVMLSTEAEVGARIRALQTGADAYVGKPYEVGQLVARAQQLLRPSGPPGDVTRILVIDDSPSVRAELSAALAGHGYEVLVAATGREGLRTAAARRPHAAVIDGTLPDIDGATVIRKLRLDAALRSIPCLLLTGSEECDDELRALDAGADAFVRKTEDSAVIIAKLSALLRRTGPLRTDTSSLLAPKKLLAVDDSPTYLHEMATLLRSQGYEVVPARSGEEAVELLVVESVDCILLDRVMPGMGGPETCRRIKAAPVLRDIPLIMVTAEEEPHSLLEALTAGADDFIAKSAEFEVLEARIRAQLRRKQLTDENRQIREQILRAEIEAIQARAEAHLTESRAAIERAEILDAANADLRDLNRLKSEFIASVSHELRTPLTSICGYTEILRDATATGTDFGVHALEVIDRNAQRLLSMVEDLLVLARIDAPRSALQPVTLDLALLVGNACEVLAPACSAASVRIVTEVTGPLTVDGEAAPLERALLNVLSNAVKFSHRGGTVVVTGAVREDRVVLTVRDTGIGIPARELSRIFTRFFRSDADTAHRVPGAGLGLAVVQESVQRHGGRVSADSSPGSGTTVTLSLPLSRSVRGEDTPR